MIEAVLYMPTHLCNLQSLFEGQEGIVVAVADGIMITGYTFCSRLDRLSQDMLSHTYLELRFYRP
jgi:hypothetical protein